MNAHNPESSKPFSAMQSTPGRSKGERNLKMTSFKFPIMNLWKDEKMCSMKQKNDSNFNSIMIDEAPKNLAFLIFSSFQV